MCLPHKSFENTGKRRNGSQQAISPLPQHFLLFGITFHQFRQIKNCRLDTLSVRKSLKFSIWKRLKIFGLERVTTARIILKLNLTFFLSLLSWCHYVVNNTLSINLWWCTLFLKFLNIFGCTHGGGDSAYSSTLLDI